MLKRMMCVCLSLILVLSSVPAQAFSVETIPGETVAETTVPETTVPETTISLPAETETTLPTEQTQPATESETEPAPVPSEETVPETEPTEEATVPEETAPAETVPEETVVETEPVTEDAESAAASASGTCGDNLTWELKYWTLTISGTGPMYDYEKSSDVPWSRYKITQIEDIVLSEGLTTIGKNAFASCGIPASIEIPDTVVSIHDNAFAYMSKLKR